MPAYDPMDVLEAWLLTLIEQDEQKAAARAAKPPKRPPVPRGPQIDSRPALRLVQGGMSLHEAARQTGVKYSTLWKHYRKENP